jgi:hypothetical protein
MLALLCLLLALLLPAAPVQAAPRAGAAASAAVLPNCSWDRPGHNPFTGELVAAVDHYTDIPAPVRARLKQRMAARQYDEIVQIRRDSIEGRHSYQPTIRGMHFGEGSMCTQVSRARWADTALERGLVYCDSGTCLLVPTVCRNLSRIERNEGGPAAPTVAGSALDSLLPPAEPVFPQATLGELLFDPPGAGLPADAAAPSFDEAASPGAWSNALPALAVLGGDGRSNPGTGAGSNGGAGGSGGSGGSGGPLPSTDGGGEPEFPAGMLPPVVSAVPEPSTWALMVLGLCGLAAAQRRRAARR